MTRLDQWAAVNELADKLDAAEGRLAACEQERDELGERISNYERYVEREIEPKLLARLARAEEALRLLADPSGDYGGKFSYEVARAYFAGESE